MTVQLEDQLRVELRAMVATEPTDDYDGHAVVAAGRAHRRRRTAWTAAGATVAVALATVTLAGPLHSNNGAVPPAGSPTASAPRVDERLVAVLSERGLRVGGYRNYSVQAGAGYGLWQMLGRDVGYWVGLGTYPGRSGSGLFLDRCHTGVVTCAPPRVTLGPNVVASPAWTQTVTDLGKGTDVFAGGRVVERIYQSGNVLEIAVVRDDGRRLAADEFDDMTLTRIVDAIGEPFQLSGAPGR